MGKKTLITIGNTTQSVTAWSKDPQCPVDAARVADRIRLGWPPKKAVFTPTMPRGVREKTGLLPDILTCSSCGVEYHKDESTYSGICAKCYRDDTKRKARAKELRDRNAKHAKTVKSETWSDMLHSFGEAFGVNN